MSEAESIDDNNKGVTKCMEKANLEDEIIHWKNKLKHIDWEYKNSMTKDWPKIREIELFIFREIARLKKIKNEKKLATSGSTMPNTSSIERGEHARSNNDAIINKDKNIAQEEEVVSEEEQWDINNKLLLESYEDEEELIKDMWLEDENYNDLEQNSDFYNSLDDVGLQNLDNAMEAMEVESSNKRRKGYDESSVKREGKRERDLPDQLDNGLQKRMIINLHISLDNIDIWVLKEEILKSHCNFKIIRMMALF
ncbi:hypothetical protein D1007_01488 [Hordeum vulgare]|nr:hypothetical protein D1007_01488 [Hordeum vulgare]